MRALLTKIVSGETLAQEEAASAMHLLLQGESQPEETAALLAGLASRGETVEELAGFTEVMREYAVEVTLPDSDAIDLCGTGGDLSHTFNVSTAAALVCAGAGVMVAKHGNRSVSSLSGSADVLEALGVKVDLGKEGVEHCLESVGLAFLFAPYFHPALRHVMPVRKKLGVRTFFNILGPLCNPARVQRQIVGAFRGDVAQKMAGILSRLGATYAITLHAEDGLDEISLASATDLFTVRTGSEPTRASFWPEQLGISRTSLETVKGGSPAENAALILGVLRGDPGPARDLVLINAAHALLTSGRYGQLQESFAAAAESIDSGRAFQKLGALRHASHHAPAAA